VCVCACVPVCSPAAVCFHDGVWATPLRDSEGQWFDDAVAALAACRVALISYADLERYRRSRQFAAMSTGQAVIA